MKKDKREALKVEMVATLPGIVVASEAKDGCAQVQYEDHSVYLYFSADKEKVLRLCLERMVLVCEAGLTKQ